VAPNHVLRHFTPDVAMLDLAITALALACSPGDEPLQYEGLRERYLPEVTFRGRVEHRNSQYALYAAACMHGGLQPDLLNDAGWWQPPLGSTASRFATPAVSRSVVHRRALQASPDRACRPSKGGLASRRSLGAPTRPADRPATASPDAPGTPRTVGLTAAPGISGRRVALWRAGPGMSRTRRTSGEA